MTTRSSRANRVAEQAERSQGWLDVATVALKERRMIVKLAVLERERKAWQLCDWKEFSSCSQHQMMRNVKAASVRFWSNQQKKRKKHFSKWSLVRSSTFHVRNKNFVGQKFAYVLHMEKFSCWQFVLKLFKCLSPREWWDPAGGRISSLYNLIPLKRRAHTYVNI